MIFVGTCGFPRAKRKLRELIDAVEVQQTFYKPPNEETLKRWREELSDMVIHVKAWQLITHPPNSPTYKKAGIKVERPENYGLLKLTDEVKKAWEVTVNAAKILNAKVIVVQTPPSFGYNNENYERAIKFFKWAKESWDLIAWEPRGSWREHKEKVREIVEETGIIHAVDPFKWWPPEGGEIGYLRLHGRGRGEVNYRYKYTDEDLKELKKKVLELNKETHVMFNNIYMLQDAIRFKEILREES